MSLCNVAVLGASVKPERYSNMAVKELLEKGHTVFPVNPTGTSIYGVQSFTSLDKISSPIDTLTIYVNANVSSTLIDAITSLHPKRVIFNPGTENEKLKSACQKNGIETLEACTLVLLKTSQF